MTQDWLLVETLGDQPDVVAQGRQMKNFVPIATFLRRSPHLAAIQTAIAETVDAGAGLASITPKNRRVIRTEPVQMPDGRIHGVHVWCGTPDAEPPDRPIPGPLKTDLTLRESTATIEFLENVGMDPAVESLTGRPLADDVPSRSLNPGEAHTLAWAIDLAPGRTYATTWGFTDRQGMFRRVGWCSRTLMETGEDGSEHLIARSMNIVDQVGAAPIAPDHLAQRILDGLAQPGVYRAIVDLSNWTLLKWVDDPCPLYDWRNPVTMHPADREHHADRMQADLETGMTTAVLRLPGRQSDWVPIHATINRIELDEGIYGGLVTLRLPTAEELADAGLKPDGTESD